MSLFLKAFSGISLVLAVLWSSGMFFSVLPAAAEEQEATADKLALKTREQRELDFARVGELLTQAREAAYKNNYSEASDCYRKARKALDRMTGEMALFKKRALDTEVRKFNASWASYMMKKARRAKLQNKFDDAINFAAEATLLDTNRNDEVDKFIAACKADRKSFEFRDKTRLADFNRKVITDGKQTDAMYREAEVFYKNRKYDKVRKILEDVFLIDPYHKKSIRLLGMTYQQMYRYGEKRRVADVRGMLAYNTWTWIDPVLPAHFEQDDTAATLTVQRNIASSTYAKLERIIFPNIEFYDADVFSVIRYLNRLSKRCDPDKAGVSVIAGFDKSTADQLNKVTMSFSNIPMSEVLRYLCQDIGLKYKIEEGAVILGTSVDEMQTEYFPVRADLISSITGTDVSAEGGVDKEKESMTAKDAD
ncbi:MAG: hypothetical protein PHV59_11205, partial [Victivallales bacterium]|nr:hypothetical protein [Victivallales bacterium]